MDGGSDHQQMMEVRMAGASQVGGDFGGILGRGGDFGGILGGGDFGGILGGGDFGGILGGGGQGGYGGGGDFRGAAVQIEPNNSQVNYLGGVSGGGTIGGSWGQGQGQGIGLGFGVWPSSSAAQISSDWNHFLNSYSSWNGGYIYPNYGLGHNLMSAPPQPQQSGLLGVTIPASGCGRPGRHLSAGKKTRRPPGEKYSRKVFIGGLPPDIDEDEIVNSFYHFGPLVVDWPRKSQGKGYFPPRGYCFLLFQKEISVRQLIDGCIRGHRNDKLFYFVSSPTTKAKPVQVRPWRLSDATFWADVKAKGVPSSGLDPNKVVFVGGVPRPLKAVELARAMDNLFGGVGYAGVTVDGEFKYPKGCGRVGFTSGESYAAAVRQRFVWLRNGNSFKKMEIKPFEGMI